MEQEEAEALVVEDSMASDDRVLPLTKVPRPTLLWPIPAFAVVAGLYAANFPSWTWFSWHPFSMMVAFVALTSAAVLVKKRGGYENTKTHGALMLAATVVALFGCYVIYSNKVRLGKPHLTSWHSWFGVVAVWTYVGLFGVGLVGLHPDFGKATKDNSLRAIHKNTAKFAIATAWGTSCLAFYNMHPDSYFSCFLFAAPLLLASAYVLQ